jgi:hypothetical protein
MTDLTMRLDRYAMIAERQAKEQKQQGHHAEGALFDTYAALLAEAARNIRTLASFRTKETNDG